MTYIKTKFDYQKKVWGASPIDNKLFSLQGMDMYFFERALKNIHSKKWRVLDLGCGAGNIAGYLNKSFRAWKIFGLDINKNAIRAAKKQFPGVTFIQGDTQKKLIKNLDLITAFDSLEHFHKLDKILENIYVSLNDNGYFYAAIPLEKQFPTIYWLLGKFGWRGKGKFSGHVNFFDAREFERLVEKHGFVLISKKYTYHFLLSIFDVLFYFYQEITGKSLAFETEVSEMKPGVAKFILHFLKSLVSATGFIESWIFRMVPGGKGHFLFIKKPKDFFSRHHPLTVAEEYQMKHGMKKLMQPRDIKIIELLKKLNYKNHRNVLDFGCADGIWLERLISRSSKKGVGVDISPELINIAKNRKKAKGKYYLSDQDWPLKKNSYDFVYSFDTFEHIENKQAELDKVTDSLKSKGIILIYTLNPNNKYTIDWFFEKLGSDYMYRRADHDKKLFISPEEFQYMLEKNGYEDVEFVLYDGPANLVGRVLSYLIVSLGLTEMNDKLIRVFDPLNNFADGFFLRRGFSNGYFLWGKKK